MDHYPLPTHSPESSLLVNRSVKESRKVVRRGFTLVELLVTIVIIIALAALSVVGIRSIRRNSHAATATASLRQNAVAIQSYAADKGNFPQAWDFEGGSGGGSWSWQIRDYLSYQNTQTWPVSTLLHPRHGTKGLDEISGWKRERLHHFSASVTVLQDLSSDPNNPKGFVRPIQVNNPSTTIMLGDAPLLPPKNPSSGCDGGYWHLTKDAIKGNPNSPVNRGALNRSVEFWINGKAHFLFVDGHVEVLAPSQVLRKHFQL